MRTDKVSPLLRILAVLLALHMALSSIAFAASPVRLFGCDEPVQSTKRGLCANQLSADDFRAIAPGVSWFYNWHFKSDEMPPAGVKVEYVPMMWGDTADRYAGLSTYLATHHPRCVLTLNEPNLKGQAFIPPEQAARAYLKTKEITDKFHLPLIGPQMALGSPTNGSISADDPIEKKKVTYTFMVPFLKAFFYYLGNTQVIATSFHSYGNIGEMKWAVGLMEKEFKRPVWVTEFAQWNAPSDEAALEYVMQSTDLLERTKNVQAYAWFKERVNGNPNISIFDKESGKLSPIGEAYVHMPVHDSDVYYKLPGKLSAGRYVTMNDMEIGPSSDENAFVQMTARSDSAWCDYNVHADAALNFTVNVRTKGDGNLAISKNGKILATAPTSGDGWQTVTLRVGLARGEQTLRVGCTQKDQVIGSLEFAK